MQAGEKLTRHDHDWARDRALPLVDPLCRSEPRTQMFEQLACYDAYLGRPAIDFRWVCLSHSASVLRARGILHDLHLDSLVFFFGPPRSSALPLAFRHLSEPWPMHQSFALEYRHLSLQCRSML